VPLVFTPRLILELVGCLVICFVPLQVKVRYVGANLPFGQCKSTSASGPEPTFVHGAANGGKVA
jgi:hypothetical protein